LLPLDLFKKNFDPMGIELLAQGTASESLVLGQEHVGKILNSDRNKPGF